MTKFVLTTWKEDVEMTQRSMVDQEGHLLLCRKISFDPSQAQVDQEDHPDLSTISYLSAILGHI